MRSSKEVVNEYLNQDSWRVKENSNSPYSYGGLMKHVDSEVSKDYWLREVYPEAITDAYRKGAMHIHDLGGLTLYCCGYSLQSIIAMGVKGIPNIPTSAPAKHFDSVLNQLANLTTVFQNEIMGAVAFSSVDTLLAPFIKVDGLNYDQVLQSLQNFIYSINSNSRGGAEPAFSNITLDLFAPSDLREQHVAMGGEILELKYGDCQKEMDMFNKAFAEVMLQGDAIGKPFAYPIPTYNIYKGFDWNHPNNQAIFEMAGKFGYPYFANFINSDMNPEDARSMCCRLRLDLTELKKRNGGLFGSGDSTGSIGVVTVNLPQLGIRTLLKQRKSANMFGHTGLREAFYPLLDEVLELAKDSLEIKREWLQKNIIDNNAVPAFNTYVGTLDNHFSTIGIVGLNEMCENLFNLEITDRRAKEFAVEVSNHIREKLVEFQQETGHLYNYEATPAESTAYRLAQKDVETFGDDGFSLPAYQGTTDAPYYTNSCHIPVQEVTSIVDTLAHQDELQQQFTGGTVVHLYMDGAISGDQAKAIVKHACESHGLPYLSISPVNRICPDHGYIEGREDNCPVCGKELDLFQRITGYIRNVKYFNDGKKAEFFDRNQYKS